MPLSPTHSSAGALPLEAVSARQSVGPLIPNTNVLSGRRVTVFHLCSTSVTGDKNLKHNLNLPLLPHGRFSTFMKHIHAAS